MNLSERVELWEQGLPTRDHSGPRELLCDLIADWKRQQKGLPLSEQLFQQTHAESTIEENLDEYGVEFESIGWDWYDNSIEIYGVDSDCRLSPEAINFLEEAGFAIAYVNHKDGWETHYALNQNKKPWRVNYEHGPRTHPRRLEREISELKAENARLRDENTAMKTHGGASLLPGHLRK